MGNRGADCKSHNPSIILPQMKASDRVAKSDKTYNIRDSPVVTHLSTSRRLLVYRWESGRDPELSSTYGRTWRITGVKYVLYHSSRRADQQCTTGGSANQNDLNPLTPSLYNPASNCYQH
ncbi:hypothetical protein CONLIGDRAFT_176189 [Coniochaeta ligniaria NRRL 30616]|uniref:Uncharacterized protein n=1 Tax=Coniochaeta ligniaria NRRL 30616 TaxID=1408157 RepID=A0A1J7JTQ8_9PEZI|nr:hypothetical protein CONLIGDRAFT_176189 [Coniochaeta ligniaria NRRL 30616]